MQPIQAATTHEELRPYAQQLGGILPDDLPVFCLGESRCRQESQWVGRTHVERVVGPHQNPVRSVFGHQVFDVLRTEDGCVEVELARTVLQVDTDDHILERAI